MQINARQTGQVPSIWSTPQRQREERDGRQPGEGPIFFSSFFRALTWNDGKSPVLCMYIYMHIMYIYIYMHIHSMYCLKGGNIKHALQEGCFFFRGWDTITINYWHLWVSEAVSSGVSPCSKRGIISSPWGIRPTEPGSCLLVSAGSGVHLLDLEAKSSFGMGLGQWIISQLPNATPPKLRQ